MRRTARKPVVLVGPATLAALGASVGELVTLTGPLGSIDLPIAAGDLADGTVWAPASAPGASVRHRVGPAGSPVSITTIVGGGR
jgi:NADH-quinone oxidoreductase subunit G